MEDVIIVGGSFAGLTAAMQLGRACRKVTVLDTGLNRNRYAEHAHNIFGHDGTPPGTLLTTAGEQIKTYKTVQSISARATGASANNDSFRVSTENGETIEGRTLILSYGIVDEFPDLPGFKQAWGKTVIHCPFCHGYEVAGKRWGLIYSSPMSLHAPALYRNWTDDITLFLSGHDIIDEERSKLDRAGVRIIDEALTAIDQEGGQVRAVILANGTHIEVDALYAHPDNRPSADLHLHLGLETKSTPTGTMVVTNDMQATSRERVFAAGDLATGMHSVTFATNAGSLAAMGVLQALMAQD